MDEDDIHEIPAVVIDAVLHSRDEFDGIRFGIDDDGATLVYVPDGPWSLHLFLLELAHHTGAVIEPDLVGREQTYHTLAELTIGITPLTPAPDHDPGHLRCRLPNIRIQH